MAASKMKYILFLLLSILILSQYVCGDDHEMAMGMLKKYNYMGANHPDPDMRGDEMFTKALTNFQFFAGMNGTGELDNETMAKLMSERCGLPDIIEDGSLMKRRKRYALAGARWVGTIGYNFKSYPRMSDLTPSSIRGEIKRAITEWSKHANLNFKESQGTSDIEISFERRSHGDNYPLDGPGLALAHAFVPSRDSTGGDLHFDDDEKWAIGNSKGTDLYYAALHELGHSLGLYHSSLEDAVMHPFYPGYIPNLSLTNDDIKGIQAIYGVRRSANILTPQSTTETKALRDQFCLDGTIDAIGTINGTIFAFQGALYAELDSSGIRNGYPRLMQEDWPGLHTALDAALSIHSHNILLFFKGESYWRYQWSSESKPYLVTGYPRTIKTDFTGGLPETVDAAYTWSGNGRTYIIKDDVYYRTQLIKVLPNKLKVRVAKWYPPYPRKFVDNWHVQENISDAFTHNGRTLFISDKHYIRYHDNKLRPDSGYPRMVASSLFGCKMPGSLVDPEMELNLMVNETQFDEAQAMGGSGTHSTATRTCTRYILHIMAIIIAIILCGK